MPALEFIRAHRGSEESAVTEAERAWVIKHVQPDLTTTLRRAEVRMQAEFNKLLTPDGLARLHAAEQEATRQFLEGNE
jgi:hypothetical protein